MPSLDVQQQEEEDDHVARDLVKACQLKTTVLRQANKHLARVPSEDSLGEADTADPAERQRFGSEDSADSSSETGKHISLPRLDSRNLANIGTSPSIAFNVKNTFIAVDDSSQVQRSRGRRNVSAPPRIENLEAVDQWNSADDEMNQWNSMPQSCRGAGQHCGYSSGNSRGSRAKVYPNVIETPAVSMPIPTFPISAVPVPVPSLFPDDPDEPAEMKEWWRSVVSRGDSLQMYDWWHRVISGKTGCSDLVQELANLASSSAAVDYWANYRPPATGEVPCLFRREASTQQCGAPYLMPNSREKPDQWFAGMQQGISANSWVNHRQPVFPPTAQQQSLPSWGSGCRANDSDSKSASSSTPAAENARFNFCPFCGGRMIAVDAPVCTLCGASFMENGF